MINLAPNAENPTRVSVRKRPLSQRLEMSVGAFLFISIAVIGLFSLLFLSHVNRNATVGYELKGLEVERKELMRQNEILSMQIADLQTLAAMDNDETIKTMVKAERPKYIRYDTAVALLDEELMPDS